MPAVEQRPDPHDPQAPACSKHLTIVNLEANDFRDLTPQIFQAIES